MYCLCCHWPIFTTRQLVSKSGCLYPAPEWWRRHNGATRWRTGASSVPCLKALSDRSSDRSASGRRYTLVMCMLYVAFWSRVSLPVARLTWRWYRTEVLVLQGWSGIDFRDWYRSLTHLKWTDKTEICARLCVAALCVSVTDANR